MSTPTNENVHQLQPAASSANAENTSHEGGVGIPAPAFQITNDDGVKEEDRDLADKYIEDLGGEEALDDAFYVGFASEFHDVAAAFETSWHTLDGYDLTTSDKTIAAQDHELGAIAMDALIGNISRVIDASEDTEDAALEEMTNATFYEMERVEICTELQYAYIDLFEAVKSKDHFKLAKILLALMKGYDYLELQKKLLELESETKTLKKMVDDANAILLKEGSDVMVDLALLGLEGTILTALGVTNPILGGIIMLSLAYGIKGAKDSVIKPPAGPDEPIGSYITTKSDESLDMMVKAMEHSGKASDEFLSATNKLGKFKAGLGTVLGVTKTSKAYMELKAIEAFYNDFQGRAEEITKKMYKEYDERVAVTGRAAKELYKSGLEIGPNIDRAIDDINYFKAQLAELE